MGNTQTSEIKLKEDKVDKININPEDIFIKIYDISKKLLIEYNNEFLNENFCNNLALIYQKNISKFHIDLLKNLHENISSDSVDEKLSLTIQYINKESDKFNVDLFKEDLKDTFWNEKFKFNNDTLLNENFKNEDIINSNISYEYIDQKHVNKILDLIDKTNEEFKDSIKEDLTPKIGGNIKNKRAKNFLNKIRPNENKKINQSIKSIIHSPVNKSNINKLENNELKVNESKVNNLKVNESISNKLEVNKSIRYIVPNSYQKPKSYCKNTEKCLLSKKELCQAITENFIVRNNIIAAILTTIPFKNNNGEYEGGVCFQMFMNLNSCKVCVPEDYKDLHKKDIKDILNGILDKSGYLTKKECKEKNGHYLELSNEEKQILGSKIKELHIDNSINDIKKEKLDELLDINYNISYVKFTKKIKKVYFEKINLLLIILEKIKDLPIINNTTLNLISEETKKVIDDMYNICYYYYIYGIISLLKVDLSKKNIIEDKIYRYVSIALNK